MSQNSNHDQNSIEQGQDHSNDTQRINREVDEQYFDQLIEDGQIPSSHDQSMIEYLVNQMDDEDSVVLPLQVGRPIIPLGPDPVPQNAFNIIRNAGQQDQDLVDEINEDIQRREDRNNQLYRLNPGSRPQGFGAKCKKCHARVPYDRNAKKHYCGACRLKKDTQTALENIQKNTGEMPLKVILTEEPDNDVPIARVRRADNEEAKKAPRQVNDPLEFLAPRDRVINAKTDGDPAFSKLDFQQVIATYYKGRQMSTTHISLMDIASVFYIQLTQFKQEYALPLPQISSSQGPFFDQQAVNRLVNSGDGSIWNSAAPHLSPFTKLLGKDHSQFRRNLFSHDFTNPMTAEQFERKRQQYASDRASLEDIDKFVSDLDHYQDVIVPVYVAAQLHVSLTPYFKKLLEQFGSSRRSNDTKSTDRIFGLAHARYLHVKKFFSSIHAACVEDSKAAIKNLKQKFIKMKKELLRAKNVQNSRNTENQVRQRPQNTQPVFGDNVQSFINFMRGRASDNTTGESTGVYIFNYLNQQTQYSPAKLLQLMTDFSDQACERADPELYKSVVERLVMTQAQTTEFWKPFLKQMDKHEFMELHHVTMAFHIKLLPMDRSTSNLESDNEVALNFFKRPVVDNQIFDDAFRTRMFNIVAGLIKLSKNFNILSLVSKTPEIFVHGVRSLPVIYMNTQTGKTMSFRNMLRIAAAFAMLLFPNCRITLEVTPWSLNFLPPREPKLGKGEFLHEFPEFITLQQVVNLDIPRDQNKVQVLRQRIVQRFLERVAAYAYDDPNHNGDWQADLLEIARQSIEATAPKSKAEPEYASNFVIGLVPCQPLNNNLVPENINNLVSQETRQNSTTIRIVTHHLSALDNTNIYNFPSYHTMYISYRKTICDALIQEMTGSFVNYLMEQEMVGFYELKLHVKSCVERLRSPQSHQLNQIASQVIGEIMRNPIKPTSNVEFEPPLACEHPACDQKKPCVAQDTLPKNAIHEDQLDSFFKNSFAESWEAINSVPVISFVYQRLFERFQSSCATELNFLERGVPQTRPQLFIRSSDLPVHFAELCEGVTGHIDTHIQNWLVYLNKFNPAFKDKKVKTGGGSFLNQFTNLVNSVKDAQMPHWDDLSQQQQATAIGVSQMFARQLTVQNTSEFANLMLLGASGGGKSYILADLIKYFSSVQFFPDKSFVFRSAKDMIHNLAYFTVDELGKQNIYSGEFKKLLEAPQSSVHLDIKYDDDGLILAAGQCRLIACSNYTVQEQLSQVMTEVAKDNGGVVTPSSFVQKVEAALLPISRKSTMIMFDQRYSALYSEYGHSGDKGLCQRSGFLKLCAFMAICISEAPELLSQQQLSSRRAVTTKINLSATMFPDEDISRRPTKRRRCSLSPASEHIVARDSLISEALTHVCPIIRSLAAQTPMSAKILDETVTAFRSRYYDAVQQVIKEVKMLSTSVQLQHPVYSGLQNGRQFYPVPYENAPNRPYNAQIKDRIMAAAYKAVQLYESGPNSQSNILLAFSRRIMTQLPQTPFLRHGRYTYMIPGEHIIPGQVIQNLEYQLLGPEDGVDRQIFEEGHLITQPEVTIEQFPIAQRGIQEQVAFPDSELLPEVLGETNYLLYNIAQQAVVTQAYFDVELDNDYILKIENHLLGEIGKLVMKKMVRQPVAFCQQFARKEQINLEIFSGQAAINYIIDLHNKRNQHQLEDCEPIFKKVAMPFNIRQSTDDMVRVKLNGVAAREAVDALMESNFGTIARVFDMRTHEFELSYKFNNLNPQTNEINCTGWRGTTPLETKKRDILQLTAIKFFEYNQIIRNILSLIVEPETGSLSLAPTAEGFIWCGQPYEVAEVVRELISTFYDITNSPSIVLTLDQFRQKLVASYAKHRKQMEKREVYFTRYMQYSPYARFSQMTAFELIMSFLSFYSRDHYKSFGLVPFSCIDSIATASVLALQLDVNTKFSKASQESKLIAYHIFEHRLKYQSFTYKSYILNMFDGNIVWPQTLSVQFFSDIINTPWLPGRGDMGLFLYHKFHTARQQEMESLRVLTVNQEISPFENESVKLFLNQPFNTQRQMVKSKVRSSISTIVDAIKGIPSRFFSVSNVADGTYIEEEPQSVELRLYELAAMYGDSVVNTTNPEVFPAIIRQVAREAFPYRQIMYQTSINSTGSHILNRTLNQDMGRTDSENFNSLMCMIRGVDIFTKQHVAEPDLWSVPKIMQSTVTSRQVTQMNLEGPRIALEKTQYSAESAPGHLSFMERSLISVSAISRANQNIVQDVSHQSQPAGYPAMFNRVRQLQQNVDAARTGVNQLPRIDPLHETSLLNQVAPANDQTMSDNNTMSLLGVRRQRPVANEESKEEDLTSYDPSLINTSRPRRN